MQYSLHPSNHYVNSSYKTKNMIIPQKTKEKQEK